MKLKIMNQHGDTQVVVEEDRETALRLFREAVEGGGMAYSVPVGGGVGAIVTELPEDGTEVDVIVRPRMVGG